MGTNPADRWARQVTTDEIEATAGPNHWERKILSLLDEGKEADQLNMVLRALVFGAGIVIANWSQDAEKDTLLAMLYLSEIGGLTQPGSPMH
jgi:hypothetical protein